MIPDYQALMLPILKFFSDRKDHTFREIVEGVATALHLTDEERTQKLPSGSQNMFDNRVGWARIYLKKAGLLEAPVRGTMKITQRGISVLAQNPDRIDVKFLKQYPEFLDFYSPKRSDDDKPTAIPVETEKDTPEEMFEVAYQKIRTSLAQDLITKITQLSPSFFEKLVVDLLVRMGYGGSIQDAGKAIGKTGDEGIDGTIKEDRLGLDIVYIQAKRWQSGNVVGRPEIQKFVGALAGQGAKKGIFITTSSFTKEAKEYQPRNETKIVLIDGEQLAQLMIDFDLGVSTSARYEVKKVDHDYFGEE